MSQKRNTFISFSYDEKNLRFLEEIKNILKKEDVIIDYSEKEDRSNFTDETIWKYLEKRIKGSSVTIVLLTKDLFEENKHKLEFKSGNFLESGWIYNEISASLRNWDENKINGVVCIYDEGVERYIMENRSSNCPHCFQSTVADFILKPSIIIQNMFNINSKFKLNKNCKFFDLEHDSFISIISLKDFKESPSKYIDNAFDKRKKQIDSNNNYFKIENNFHKKDQW